MIVMRSNGILLKHNTIFNNYEINFSLKSKLRTFDGIFLKTKITWNVGKISPGKILLWPIKNEHKNRNETKINPYRYPSIQASIIILHIYSMVFVPSVKKRGGD